MVLSFVVAFVQYSRKACGLILIREILLETKHSQHDSGLLYHMGWQSLCLREISRGFLYSAEVGETLGLSREKHRERTLGMPTLMLPRKHSRNARFSLTD